MNIFDFITTNVVAAIEMAFAASSFLRVVLRLFWKCHLYILGDIFIFTETLFFINILTNLTLFETGFSYNCDSQIISLKIPSIHRTNANNHNNHINLTVYCQ